MNALPDVNDPETLTVHPVAAWFPMLDEPELQALANDIARNGLIEPIVVRNGVLIDGRNRLAACVRADVEPEYREWQGDEADIQAWIIGRNLHRRHLNESQRALIARRANLHSGLSAATAAEQLNVSRRSVFHAAAVLEHGATELVAAVDRGEVAVSAAAELVRAVPDPVAQAEVVREGPAAVAQVAREERERRSAERVAWFPTQPEAPTSTATNTPLDLDDPVVQGHLAALAAVDDDSDEVLVIAEPALVRGVETGREVLDAYWTPDVHAATCIRWMDAQGLIPEHPQVVEPAVGGGSWVRAVRAVRPGAIIDRFDLDLDAPGLAEAVLPGDRAIGGRSWLDALDGAWDFCPGNPPYGGDLVRWLDLSLDRARVVAYLLRETATGSLERLPWWQAHRPAWIAKVLPRPRWLGPGARPESDTCDSVLVVWVRGVTETRWDWIDCREVRS